MLGVKRALLAALLPASLGCVVWPAGGGAAAGPVKPEDALAMRDRGRAVIVDVREPAQFAGGHIPGALNIPASEIDARAQEIRRLDRLPILYCG